MKLPEYDNRPPAGQPLYSSNKSEGEDIKFTILGLGLPALILVSLGLVVYGIAELFAHLFAH